MGKEKKVSLENFIKDGRFVIHDYLLSLFTEEKRLSRDSKMKAS